MKISQSGIDLIKRFEGCKLTAYKAVPTEPYFTIGYGHYSPDVKAGMVISQALAEKYLKEDLERFEKYVNDLTSGLNQNQFDALVSFTYNCGPGNLKKLLAGRSLADIPDALLLYNKSGGKVLNGLVKRRQAERELFLSSSEKKVQTMPVKIAHASIDENGKGQNGKAGDQNGKEVCIRNWYNKPWTCVIRFNDVAMRERVAVAMENAANNKHIGYDKNQRNTLLKAVRSLKYDPKNVTSDVETDCSALETVACIYAGIPEADLVKGGNCATTSTLKALLKATGKVTVFTSKEYTSKADNLIRGDILLAEGSHVATVVSGNTSNKSIEEIAKACLRGEYGNGATRKAKLTEAGYDYNLVQQTINTMLKEAKDV